MSAEYGFQPPQSGTSEPTSTIEDKHEAVFVDAREEMREASAIIARLHENFRDRWAAIGARGGYPDHGKDADRICVQSNELFVSDGIRSSIKVRPTNVLRYHVLQTWFAAQTEYPFNMMGIFAAIGDSPHHSKLSEITGLYLQRKK